MKLCSCGNVLTKDKYKTCMNCIRKRSIIRKDSIKNCIDCNKKLSKQKYVRCLKCSQLNEALKRKLERPKCLVCNEQLISLKSKRCRSCAVKENWNNEETKKKTINSLKNTDYQKQRKIKSLSNPFRKRVIENSIRNLKEYVDWRFSIYKRDNFTCTECNSNKCYLQADHIKPFKTIFREFIAKYNMFSPIEDKETLVRLAITYEPFWDLSNGRTLCRECHIKTPTYGRKK